MSEWYEIKEPEAISLSLDGKSINVQFDYNDFGAVYIEIPVDFILKKLSFKDFTISEHAKDKA